MRRLILCILVLTMLLSATGCTLFMKNPEGRLPEPTNPANTQPVATQPIETQPVAVEEPGVTPIEILIGGQYISEWTDDYIILGYVSWDSLTLSQKSAEEYPALAAALEEYCAMDGSWAEEMLQDMLPDARRMAEQMGNDFYGYSYETTCSVQRADSQILSVCFDYFAYTGGARPYYGTTVLNLDPATGGTVTLTQVVKDLEALPKLLVQALKEKYIDIEQETFGDISQTLSAYAERSFTWTLGYQGITFYFAPSEIAPAALGDMEVTLWFDQYPELFQEDYTRIPEGGYVIPVPDRTLVDVNMRPNDDSYDQVFVTLDDEGTLYITKNGNTYEDAGYFAYYADSYLVTPDNEHFYLYVDSSAENDYSIFRVYDMSGTQPRRIDLFEGEGFSGVWMEDYVLGPTWFNAVFNDPTHFLLAGHLNLLGTMSGTRPFHMDPETGIPVAEANYYTLPEEREPLVTKIPITVKLLPGQVNFEIPAGTRLWFLRTDGETYVDMRMADGKQCRIYITYRDWQGYVDGRPEEECFEGIMYAG